MADLTFLPESYKGDDGEYDTEKFTADYDGLVSFKAQADEASEALPKEAADYAFGAPEDHVFPEGFVAADHQQPVLDDKGEPVLDDAGKATTRDYKLSDMLDPNDPDISLLQAAMHKHGVNPDMMGDIASIMGNRELRGLMKAGEESVAEKTKLGPEGQSRIDTVNRTLAAKIPAEQAKAIADGITSADALRGVEALLKASKIQPNPIHKKGIDNATASIEDRIMAGIS